MMSSQALCNVIERLYTITKTVFFQNSRKKFLEEIKTTWGKSKEEEDFAFVLIEEYFKNIKPSAPAQILSERVMHDIDFYELFKFADRTTSKPGQQFLYNKLRAISFPPDFSDQEKLIAFFEKNQKARIQSQALLSKLSKKDAYFITDLLFKDYIKPSKWFFILKLLSFLALAGLIGLFFMPTLLIFFILVASVNSFLHYWNKHNIYRYVYSIPQLLLLCKTARGLLKMNIPGGTDIRVQNSITSIEKLKNRFAVFTVENDLRNEALSIFWLGFEFIKMIFLIEPLALFNALGKLELKKTDMHNIFDYIGKIDCSLSIASLRSGLDYWCVPTIIQDPKHLEFDRMYHPLVLDCIPNTLKLKNRSLLLTGSNMSGKTTFIRSIAINCLFAQTINTCFAESFSSSSMKLFSAVRISDDLFTGKSYYFEEVLTIKNLIEESESENNLFLLDEIFKGTNTIERIAAGKAVLSHLDRGNNIVIVSTHDVELMDLLEGPFDLFHFSEHIEKENIHFDYILKQGKLTSRNAVKILALNNYPDEIVREAQEISKEIGNRI